MQLLRVFSATTVLAATMFGLTAANLSGSGTITYHDYRAIPLDQLKYNPPSCGMPYAELDLDRITAVQQMNTATDCGQCIKITNANDPSKFVYALAVDTGGRGLDLSKASFGKLFNIDDGVGPASWSPVANSNCAGAWSNLGSGPYDGSTVPAPPAEQEKPQPVAPAPSSSVTPRPWSSSPAPAVVPPVQSTTSRGSSSVVAPPVAKTSIVVPQQRSSVPASVHSQGSATVRSLSSGSTVDSTIANAPQSAIGQLSVDSVSDEQLADVEKPAAAVALEDNQEDVSGVGHNAKEEDSLSEDSMSEDSDDLSSESGCGSVFHKVSAFGVFSALLTTVLL
ncbi:hypothetical protein GGF40_002220 [Coemansia sp. RSA 1286]|nr:hypothetical protein IWW45_004425 [Coemansia sp. RSA 485]KAJ2603413.1 hypothetical protein GGF39_000137 [Coemansia sp. RSA 1721]KAJ2637636.1 hypothetical protein GGF40_002220 [Coemansia sp. RSA 1286]